MTLRAETPGENSTDSKLMQKLRSEAGVLESTIGET